MTTQPLAPPPPPPPVPPAGGARTIDFGRPFTYVFEDPGWLPKILIGGLMYLLGFLIIGFIFVAGYAARLARNVAAGETRPLPEWDQWGDDFIDGLRIFGVVIVYYLPVIIIAIIAFGGGAALTAIAADQGDAAALAGSGFMSVGICLFYALVLAIMVILPAAILLVVMRRSFAAGFDFATIFRYIRENLANYVLALAIYLITGFIAQFGVILLCIGVLFTSFWALVASTYAFGEGYRYSRVK